MRERKTCYNKSAMSNFRSSSLPERNPATHEAHRREVLWQITVPFVILTLVFLAFAVLTVLGDTGDQSRWADISLIWLIIPVLFASLILLVLLGALVFAVLWLIGALPPFALTLQDIFSTIHAKVRQASDAAVEPVLKVEAWKASIRALRSELRNG